MITDLFTTTVLIGIISSGIRLATPYLFAGIGEMFSQRSGVLNLGVEGQMLLGAFAAYYVVLKTGNLFFGILAAIGVGALMGLAMGFVTIHLKATQGIAGIGFYLFGMGMSNLLFQKLIGMVENINGFPSIKIPLWVIFRLSEKYFSSIIYWFISPFVGAGCLVCLEQNTIELEIRAVGETPKRRTL